MLFSLNSVNWKGDRTIYVASESSSVPIISYAVFYALPILENEIFIIFNWYYLFFIIK